MNVTIHILNPGHAGKYYACIVERLTGRILYTTRCASAKGIALDDAQRYCSDRYTVQTVKYHEGAVQCLVP